MKTVLVFLSLSIFVASLFFASFLVRPSKSYDETFPTPTPFQGLDSQKLWTLVNNWRVSAGFKPYLEDQRLCKLADVRVKEIQTQFSHKGFASHWHDFAYRNLAENIAKDFYTEQDTLDAWLASKDHLRDLRYSNRYSCIRTDGTYAVQIFANF